MPIYEYRCTSCAFQKEYLQKVSDPVLSECPKCGKSTFSKMLTAAGFQLKGSGWYATDFKNGTAPKPGAADGKASEKPAGEKSEAAADTKTDSKSDSASTEAKPAASPAPAPTPAAGSSDA
jgi:putative FmdB family regulatory protein